MITSLAPAPLSLAIAPNSLLKVLREGGWTILEEGIRPEGVHRCHACRGKFHVIGEGLTRGAAQKNMIETIVEFEWDDCFEAERVAG